MQYRSTVFRPERTVLARIRLPSAVRRPTALHDDPARRGAERQFRRLLHTVLRVFGRFVATFKGQAHVENSSGVCDL